NAPEVEIRLPGVTASELDTISRVAKFDLTLDVARTRDGYVGRWEYNTDLFDATTVDRMAARLDALLHAIGTATGPVGRMPIMPEVERRALLHWSAGLPRTYDYEQSLPELFEQRARLAPDAIALVSGNVNVTYGELELRSKALAQRLIDRGVGI